MANPHSSWTVKAKRELQSWDTVENGCFKLTTLAHAETNLPPSIVMDTNQEDTSCAWCGQSVIGENGVRGHVDGIGSQKLFCSDVCYSQSRRAAFKRAKICDWCKHVRHTVTYVDLHDGRRQLQFCTDKCRNQYKMQLFCAEATSLGVLSCGTSSGLGDTTTGIPIDHKKSTHGLLITPELWLADSTADNGNNAKPECSDDAEVCSNDSDPDDQAVATDIPLNLVHSSRLTSHRQTKRRQDLTETKEISHIPSKKGKSHRKPSTLNISQKIQQSLPTSSMHAIPQLPPPLTQNIWPTFPYPQHLPPHPYLFQSPLLALSQAIKPAGIHLNLQENCDAPQMTSFREEISDETTTPETTEQKAQLDTESDRAKQNLNKQEEKLPLKRTDTTGQLTLPPNFVVLRIPTLVPLPIPVPIPIPINENYFKQRVT